MPSARLWKQTTLHQSLAEDAASPAMPTALGERTVRFWPIWLMAFGGALAVYAATVAPDVLMMDYGEYQRSTWLFPQITPPQGLGNLVRVHINYLMAAKLFGLLLPVGQWALRINLFSAAAGSIAAGNACALAFALTRSKPAAVLTWLALTLGQTSWQYAVIAHVLSFQAATISGELLVLYLWSQSDRFRWLLALWAINGIAAGAHVQNGLATPVYLIVLVLAWRQGRVGLRQVVLCMTVWLAGFSPYLVFCARQWITHGAGGSAAVSMTMGSWAGRMWQLNPRVWLRGLLLVGMNYPTGLALLYIPGVWALLRSPLPGSFRWGWLTVIAVNLLFAMTYNVPDQQSFFVPFYAAACPLIGLGAVQVLRTRASRAVALALGVLVVPVYAALPVILRVPAIAHSLPAPEAHPVAYRDPYQFYLKPWKTGWHNDRRYIEEAFQSLPQDAIFLCSSTIYDGLRTVQVIESRRGDITLNPSEAELARNMDNADGLAGRWRRPVYCWTNEESRLPKALSHCRFVAKGIVWEVLPPNEADREEVKVTDANH
jgi:hypothetical protein